MLWFYNISFVRSIACHVRKWKQKAKIARIKNSVIFKTKYSGASLQLFLYNYCNFAALGELDVDTHLLHLAWPVQVCAIVCDQLWKTVDSFTKQRLYGWFFTRLKNKFHQFLLAKRGSRNTEMWNKAFFKRGNFEGKRYVCVDTHFVFETLNRTN